MIHRLRLSKGKMRRQTTGRSFPVHSIEEGVRGFKSFTRCERGEEKGGRGDGYFGLELVVVGLIGRQS